MSKFMLAATPPVTTQPGTETPYAVDGQLPKPLQLIFPPASPDAVVRTRSPATAVAWTPRIGATHLSKGSNGIWYMRLVVPARIRARHPELPKELKRSTKVAEKSLARAKAREMCLDFSIKYSSGATMLALDEKSDQSFALFYEDGKVRIDHSRSANPETLILMTRCFERMMLQVAGRGQRAANDPSATAAHPAQLSPVQAIVLSPLQSPSLAPAPAPTPDQSASNLPGVPWLSDAIDEWLENGGTKFSDLSWKNSYEPTFRIFRELVGDTRRDRAAKDGILEFGVLDIQLHRLTRAHIEAFHEGVKRLPANQGRSTKETEAHDRIRQGAEDKVKWPSLSSVDKKLCHVAPFISYAGRKGWVGLEVVSQMTLATQSAKANLVKASKNTTQKKGAVALSEAELHKMFEQPAFVNDAMLHDWRYWIPQICLYMGTRVSEASGLHTDDILEISGVSCISIIPDDPENENEIDGDLDDEDRTRKIQAKTSEEYRRVKNRASRRVMPIHPKLIEQEFLDYVNAIRDYSPRSTHLFYGLTWDQKTMYGRKPSRYMRGLIKTAGFYVARRKVPHSLRSNFHQAINKTLLPGELQKRLLGHSTGAMKDEKYNETDQGPALPFAEVLQYLSKVDFGLNVPTWSEVRRLGHEARVLGTLKRPVTGS